MEYSSKAYIKDICLGLPGYKYTHHPIKGEGGEIFLGRKSVLDKLVNMLEYGDNKGSYLITGYRGMGKTSYVRKAIKEYEEKLKSNENNDPALEKTRIVQRHISLAQNDITEIDILRQIAMFVQENLLQSKRLIIINYLERKTNILFFASCFFILDYFRLITLSGERKDSITDLLILSLVFGIFLYIFIQIIIFLIRNQYPDISKLVNTNRKLEVLYDRCQGELSRDEGIDGTNEQFPLGYIDKKSKKYHPLTAKEASNELINILDQYKTITFFQFKKKKVNQIQKPQFSQSESIFIIILITALLSFLYYKSIFHFIKLLFEYPCSYKSFLIDTILSYLFIGIIIVIIFIINYIIKNEFISFKNKFIFVFDELDKLELQSKKENNNNTNNGFQYDTYTNSLREKKQLVLGLLSSLKYLVSEANARFIFIAGREMFDASLADIADRQSSLSSIFHQVIYIDSFYRDKSDNRPMAAGVGEMVEEYLEEILIPENSLFRPEHTGKDFHEIKKINSEYHFLSNYYQYLKSIHNKSGKLSEEEILKVVFSVQNMIIYIAYRSSGSPKKMVRLIEENIVSESHIDDPYRIIASNYHNSNIPESKLYLKLSYNNQYKHGFTSYLFRPFLLMYGNHIRKYGDSLLVSTPYLMDNLIKFHPFAFSVKNLELLPEIISSNKSPELRLFIEELIFFFSQNHIRETESGLFEYKFYDRTHNEITFLSKIVEEESAAFNFTLDENYPIKKHLAARINELRSIHKDFKDRDSNNSMSLAFLNDLLGDAELNDEEFEDAIISYSDALHVLPNPRISPNITIENLVLYGRFKLKMGMAHEKMKAFDVALGHYADAYLLISDFILGRLQLASPLNELRPVIKNPSQREMLQFASRSLASLIYLQEKMDEGLTFQKLKEFSASFQELLSVVGRTEYLGRDIIEARHYTQIALITYYKNLTLPFDYLKGNATKLKALFFEPPTRKSFFRRPKASFFSASFQELTKKYGSKIFNRDNSCTNRDFRFSFISYVHYKKSLASYLSDTQKDVYLKVLVQQCFKIIFSFENSHDKNILRGIANTLSRIGDLLFTLYPSDDSQQKFSQSILKSVREYYNNKTEGSIIARLDRSFKHEFKRNKNLNTSDEELDIDLDYIIFIYYLSARFFLKAGRTNSSSFQFRKILLLCRSFVVYDTPRKCGTFIDCKLPPDEKLTSWLETTFVKKILEISSWNNNSSDRRQILKFKDYFDIFSIQTPKEYSKFIYTNLSNHSETKDAILILAGIKVKNSDYSSKKYKELRDFSSECQEQSLITPYNGISHQITRIMELELQVKMNFKFLRNNMYSRFDIVFENSPIKLKDWQSDFFTLTLNSEPIRKYKFHESTSKSALFFPPGNPSASELTLMKEFAKDYIDLTVNSIHCLYQIINSLKVYNINYFLNNFYQGNFHEKLGDWIKHLYLCKLFILEFDLKNDPKYTIDLDKVFNHLLGFRVIHTLDVLPQYQLALQHYYESIQVHSEGAAYKYQISNFIYLEDDYNDNLYHFGAALERQRINSGYVRKKMEDLEKETERAGILDYDNFVNIVKFK